MADFQSDGFLSDSDLDYIRDSDLDVISDGWDVSVGILDSILGTKLTIEFSNPNLSIIVNSY